MKSNIVDIVDVVRYPILNLASTRAKSLITACRSELNDNGLCLLENFIRPTALRQMQAEASRLSHESHYSQHWRATPNGTTAGSDVDSSSVLSRATRASIRCVAYDRLDEVSLVRHLYDFRGLIEFINAIYNRTPLYDSKDPIVSCMLTYLQDKDELGWHYDPNDGVVSLAIQQADTGGEFEFAHDIRAPCPNARQLEDAVLANASPNVQSISLKPGTLSLFNGHRSLHRVAPVRGSTARVVALFNYCESPNYRFSDKIRQQFFGRTM